MHCSGNRMRAGSFVLPSVSEIMGRVTLLADFFKSQNYRFSSVFVVILIAKLFTHNDCGYLRHILTLV